MRRLSENQMKLKHIQDFFCKKIKGKCNKLRPVCRRIGKDQRVMAALLAVLGCANVGVSALYQPVAYKMIDVKTIPATEQSEKSTVVSTPSEAEMTAEEGSSRVLSVDEMNLFHVFPDGAEDTFPVSSVGGQIFTELTEWDLDWAGAVYSYSHLTPAEMTEKMGISKACIIGDYNPENKNHAADDPSTWTIDQFRNVWFLTEDGDGNSISPYSNIFQIMSLANVYSYYQDPDDSEAFLSYCKELWKASHFYTLVISDVYHCSGCVRKNETAETAGSEPETEANLTDGERETGETGENGGESATEGTDEIKGINETEEENKTEGEIGKEAADSTDEIPETAGISETTDTGVRIGTESNATPEIEPAGDEGELYCPGHVDLTIVLKIAGLTEENNLFTLDATGNDESGYTQNGWQGWKEEKRQAALRLAEKDWYLEYGLSTELSSPQLPVSTVDVDAYLGDLPFGLSQERKNLLRFALNSVGRVPYYWGGKPSAVGYEGNNFGTAVSPDTEGRSLKGLDCSGWISWVYWSATGKRLPYESTSGLASLGERISKEELQPGDILVRTGKDAHTVMFLGWTQDGKIQCVHETSGSVNNVTISIRDADWPYYIRLME